MNCLENWNQSSDEDWTLFFFHGLYILRISFFVESYADTGEWFGGYDREGKNDFQKVKGSSLAIKSKKSVVVAGGECRAWIPHNKGYASETFRQRSETH